MYALEMGSLDMDVVGFARRVLSSSDREASDEEVFSALLRCGAPRDSFTARLQLYSGIKKLQH